MLLRFLINCRLLGIYSFPLVSGNTIEIGCCHLWLLHYEIRAASVRAFPANERNQAPVLHEALVRQADAALAGPRCLMEEPLRQHTSILPGIEQKVSKHVTRQEGK